MAIAVTEGDEPILHLESNPRPDGAVTWPRGTDPAGQTISAPITPERLGVVEVLLADAVRTWARAPGDVALTFGSSPYPPLQL